jgi:hypothetical protein
MTAALTNASRPGRLGTRMPSLPRLAVVLLLVAGLVPAGRAAAASTLEVRLAPDGAVGIPQGLPFAFTASIRNTGTEAVSVQILFALWPPGGGSRRSFGIFQDVVQPGATLRSQQSVVSGQWFADTGRYTVTATVEPSLPQTPRVDFQVLPPPVQAPAFKDVTTASGIDVVLPRPTQCRWAAGAAWADVDGDGDLDLYVPHPDGPAQLWINDGAGHFVDEAASRGVDDGGSVGVGAVFADYDRDGDPDLYVSNMGPNRLYQNDGTGHFIDVAVSAGVADAAASFSAAWGDYDSDGWPDLYVTDYRQCLRKAGYDPDRLYHNNGDGTFTDVTSFLPLSSTEGAGFQAGWFDYNSDGRPDLYLANDALGELFTDRNRLWRNDGPDGNGGWIFTDVSIQSGANFDLNSMGLGIADYDRDMDLDLAVSNIGASVLARNNGDGTFTDVATAAGVARPRQNATRGSITWGLAFADFNLDGWEDLYVNAGSLIVHEPQPNELFVNAGRDGRFLDLSAASGAADPGTSRGVSFADFDRDGRMDMFVVDQGGRSHLYRNVTPYQGHWLEVRLRGMASNTDGCGTRLTFTAGGGQMLREVFCGSTGLSGGSDSTVHVGLGGATTVDQLVIEWPSGRTQTLDALGVDALVTVTEPARG